MAIRDNNLQVGLASEPIEPEFQRYLRILSERRWSVIGTLLAGMALFALWGSRQPKIYQATATIVVDAAPPQVLGQSIQDVVQVGPGQYYAMQDYIQTQRRVLTSDSLARHVVRRLHLENDSDFWLGPSPKNVDEAGQAFVGAVSANPILDTQLIVVSYQHRDPKQAKRAVDGLADAYIESNLDLRDNSNLSAASWLADEEDQLRARLSSSEMALYDFKRKNELLSVSLEDRINSVTRQIDKLSDALTEVRIRKVSRSSEADELARMTADSDGQVAPVNGSEVLTSLKHERTDEDRKLSELRARYEDIHPLVRQQEAKVHAIQAALLREVAMQLRGAQARTNEAIEQERKIAAQLEAAKQEGLRTTRLEVEYNKLKREADALSKQYLLVQTRTKETQLASKLKVNNLHVLDYARLPSVPVSPHLGRGAVVAGVLSLLLGILLGLSVDSLDRSLKTQEDVETKLGVPFLGLIPSMKTDRVGDMFVADNPQSAVAECCRLIRTNLMFVSVSKPLRRLLVTSSVAREGKTVTTVNLGVVLAQGGNKVLIIDSDLRRPRLKAALGMTDEVGLTNVLLGNVPLDEAIRPTRVPNLFVLLSGPVPPNPAELVDGPRFREVMEECSEKFERVLLDSPPAVPVTDPAVLAGYCDGVVMVVRAGRTAHNEARRARRNLVDAGARILGAVLNDCDIKRRGYGSYGYAYGYYGSDRGRGEKPSTPSSPAKPSGKSRRAQG